MAPSASAENRRPPAISIGLFGLQDWYEGQLGPVLDIVSGAEAAGMDEISLSDHVVMGEDVDQYPYGAFGLPPSYPFYEPVTLLAALSTLTHRVQLTAILISPLRSAVLLAKQLATLDVLSGGRLNIGFGVGWQKAEYDFSGVPWEGRFGRMEEQVEACRELWTKAPATYVGKTVSFDRAYSLPFPAQSGGIPIWFGLPPTPRNFDRIARHAGGWYPMQQSVEELARGVADLRSAYVRHGVDPALLTVRSVLLPIIGNDGRPDLERTLAQLPKWRDAGVTTTEIHPMMYCSGPEEIDDFFATLAAFKAGV